MTRKEELEMLCEKTTVRLLNDTFTKLTEKYEDLLKTQTETEIDKVNAIVKEECPEYGAIVINLDGCELSFPYTDNTTINIINGKENYKINVGENKDIDIEKLINFMLKPNDTDVVTVNTYTEKCVDFYNKKELINNNKIKETKTYIKSFTGTYPKNKISAIYKLNGTLK